MAAAWASCSLIRRPAPSLRLHNNTTRRASCSCGKVISWRVHGQQPVCVQARGSSLAGAALLGVAGAMMEYVSPEGLRLDGRRPPELRALSAELGTLARADGSATFQMGNTKVMAAVFGPREMEIRSQAQQDRAVVKCEYAMAPFSTGGERRRRGKTDRRSTELTMVIRETLEQNILVELLPRSQIDIYVQVLEADGGTRCACINAAMLALADAGIPCKDLLSSCAAGFLDSTPLLDLNYTEDAGGGPDVSVALQNSQNKVVLLQMDNKMKRDEFQAVLKLAEEGCRAVANFMRAKMLERTRLLANARGAVQL